MAVPQHSFGLAVYQDHLFWTDWVLRAVIRVNKYTGGDVMYLQKNIQRQPMSIVVVAPDINECKLGRRPSYSTRARTCALLREPNVLSSRAITCTCTCSTIVVCSLSLAAS